MPHVPIFASEEFLGTSSAGLYGDVIEEIDWSLGEIVRTLEESNIQRKTLVIFTSDNGPWKTLYDLGGSAGPFRDGKMTAWEGAFRVPCIFWWPGTIGPSVAEGIGVGVDTMATLASLTPIDLPRNRELDSIDLSQTLLEGSASARTEWFYYGQPGNLWAARVGNHKLVLESWESIGFEGGDIGWRGFDNRQVHDPTLLFDLSTDPGERLDIAANHPEVVEVIQRTIKRYHASLAGQPSSFR
jgi:arylsulfatase A-like enzyme